MWFSDCIGLLLCPLIYDIIDKIPKEKEVIKMTVCNMDCFHCKFSDCINDSDVLSDFERKVSRQTDSEILVSRGLTYLSTSHMRQNKEVEPVAYKKAQRRHFHRKYYLADPEKHRALARAGYRKYREARLKTSHEYYDIHKEEILANKRTYYQEHREEILAKRKRSYKPKGKRPVIDTPEAEAKRQRELERYHKNKEEINRRRRERRKQQNENH